MDVIKWIEQNQNTFINANDNIWGFAELKFDEGKSAELLKGILKEYEFKVQETVGDMDTAFIASYGSGKPVIGILAEYDALSGISQKPDSFVKEKQKDMENGHGCGHHTFGVASTAAAVAVKEYIKEHNIQGTIRLYGCPGEEGGSGKAFMAREGVFDDLDCAFAWHPGSFNGVIGISLLANIQAYFKFYGRSSHAAVSPHLGRSAFDAVELMNVGVNYLREHIIPEARVHYAVTNTGGNSPNVVQSEAEVLYLMRAPQAHQVNEIFERVCDIAKGAALMTGTRYEVIFDKACSNVIPNDVLGRVMYKKMKDIGAPKFTDEEKEYALKYIKTFTENEKNSNAQMSDIFKNSKEMNEYMKSNACKCLADEVMPYFCTNTTMPGSSDVGDVSWITPTTQCGTTCYAASTPAHSWQMVAQGKSSIAHKGMIYAAKTIALTTIEVLQNPEIAEKAKKELKEYLGEKKYVCPIPSNVKPKPYK